MSSGSETSTLTNLGDRTSAPTFGRLLTTELRRLAARRFTRVLLGLCVIGYLIAVAYVWQAHAKETPADIAQATAQRDQQIVQIATDTANCLKQPGGSAEQCGTVPTAEEFPISQFLSNNPFQPNQVSDYALAVGVAVGMAGFVLAATSIGAEWSSKNVVAWLFYEPRRMRLMWAKLLALTGVVLVLSVVAQLIWAVTGRLLLRYRGLPVSSLVPPEPSFWTDVAHLQVRAALLVVPMALLGFGLANLIKNTAAALGAAFVYFVVVESIARAVSPGLQPYMFTTSVEAWVSRGGIDVFGNPVYNQQQGFVAPELIHVSNLQGAITLVIYAAVVLGISLLLFRRRDIT